MDTLDNLDVNVGDQVVFQNPNTNKQYKYEITEVNKTANDGYTTYTRYRGFQLNGEYSYTQVLSSTRPNWAVIHRATINKKPQPTFEVIFEDGSTQRFNQRIVAVVEYEAMDHPMAKVKKVNFFNEKGENS